MSANGGTCAWGWTPLAKTALETVLRRDRIVVAAALAGLAALAWGYVLWLGADMNMGGMDMTGFRMIPAGLGIMAPANAPWKAIEFAFVFAMWAVMMVGMMAPSAAPMILTYACVGEAAAEGTPFAATGWFAGGYFLAWIGFSLAATVAQWTLERSALLDVEMASASAALGGAIGMSVRKTAAKFAVNPSTVQRVAHPFEGADNASVAGAV